MWFRSSFDSLSSQGQQLPRCGKRAADRRRDARRLFLESLEDRRLMAFNVLGQYDADAATVMLLTRIDGGSQPDLVVANSGDNSISVRLGNSNGTFGAVRTSATGGTPHSLAAGDFTSDGVADMVTANSADISLLQGNGDGTFVPLASISLPAQVAPGNPDPGPLGQSPRSVAVGDLNSDGKLDLVVGGQTSFSVYKEYYSCGYYSCSYYGFWQTYSDGYVNVLLGNGSGGFSPAEVHHLDSYRLPNAVAVRDINGDSRADVITANNYDLSVLLGDGAGAVGSPINSGSGYSLPSLSLGDLDGDGKVDALLSSGYGGLSVQKGDGLGHFTPLSPVSTGGAINSAVTGDVNADGKLDLVAVSSLNSFTCTSYGYYGCYGGDYEHSREATVLLGNGLGNFALPLTSSLGGETGYGSLIDLGVADLTGDGLPELVTIDRYGSSYYASDSISLAIVGANNGDWNPPPAIVVSEATVIEGNSGTVNAVFTVTIVGTHGAVSVDFSTTGSTAAAGSDYTTTSGSLSFAAGDTSKTISVPVVGDTTDEYDEQFFVNLSNAVGGVITDSQAVGTIQDNDAAPLVTINDISANEGNQGTTSFVFTVSLSAASGKWVYVDFATANGTATTSDNDYFANSGTIYFSPGQLTQSITDLVRGDKKKEPNETFFVNLTGATNATISDNQGVGTIVNNDGGNTGGKGKPTSNNTASLLLTDPTLSKTSKKK